MSGHDAKYFTTTKKGEIHELKEELNSQYKVRSPVRPCSGVHVSSVSPLALLPRIGERLGNRLGRVPLPFGTARFRVAVNTLLWRRRSLCRFF